MNLCVYRESIDLLMASMNDKDMKHKSKFEQVQQRKENEIALNRWASRVAGLVLNKTQNKF